MRLLLDTAVWLMQDGAVPSVSQVAEAAAVSRATAYRYFPSQAALVSAVVDEALGPILDWNSRSPEPRARLESLLATALPRLDAFEATFRAALMLSLEQWSKRRKAILGAETPFVRGHRIDLLGRALAPLTDAVGEADAKRLQQALSLLFGVEALIVLKDIWSLDAGQAHDVIAWAATALLQAATNDGGMRTAGAKT